MLSRLVAFVVSVMLLVGSFGVEASGRAMAAARSGDVPAAVADHAALPADLDAGSSEPRPLEERPVPSAAEPSGESTALPSAALTHQGPGLALAPPARRDAALPHGPYLDGILRPPRLRSLAA